MVFEGDADDAPTRPRSPIRGEGVSVGVADDGPPSLLVGNPPSSPSFPLCVLALLDRGEVLARDVSYPPRSTSPLLGNKISRPSLYYNSV